MKRIGLIICIVSSLLLFTRCASTGFLMAKPKVTLFGETYQPKDVYSKIDVFITNKPTQEYIEFANITCRDTNDTWSMAQIKKQALLIGADGIIITGSGGNTSLGIPMGNSMYFLNEKVGISAIAI